MKSLFSKKALGALKAEASIGYGVCDGTWTPTVSGGNVVLTQPSTELANKAVEVTGLVAPADLTVGSETYTIDNGNVVVFNITGDVVAAHGSVLVPME